MEPSRYLVSARKYRPQTFGEVVGQEHVAETLRNALRLDRLAHAYLFSGPRGVGKTTAARILAKAINCEKPLSERPDAEPCRVCASCRDFEDGRSLNIIEIDAASNNKVDDIRELRETVRIPPQGARRKVYIVDEVHMLSTSAFNALLKTLEEPPPYVLFIFATTEPHKVLPTILSRCQRFDFRRIAVDDAVEHLRHICAEEGFSADDASLMLIARKGDGALRDTLSAFDQAVALVGQDVRYPELAEALGVIGIDPYFEATDALRDRSGAALLGLVDRLVRRGHDLPEFLVGMQEHLRNLLVARTLPDAKLIEADEATRARYREAAGAFAEPDLLRLLALAAEAEEALKTAAQPRLRLELTLLKMVALASVRDLNAALNAVGRLEKMARDGTLGELRVAEDRTAGDRTGGSQTRPHTAREEAAPRPESRTGGSQTRPDADAARPLRIADAPAPYDDAPHAADAPEDAAHANAGTGGSETRPDSAQNEAPRSSAPRTGGLEIRPGAAHEDEPRPDSADDGGPEAPALPRVPIPRAPTSAPPRADEPDLTLGSLFSGPALTRRARRPPAPDAPTDAAVAARPHGAVPEAAPDTSGSATGFATVRRAWPGAVKALSSPRLAAALAGTRPSALDEAGVLTVVVESDLAAHALHDAAALLCESLHAHAPVRTLRAHIVRPQPTGDGAGTSEPGDPYARVRALRDEHPVAAALLDALGGEIA